MILDPKQLEAIDTCIEVADPGDDPDTDGPSAIAEQARFALKDLKAFQQEFGELLAAHAVPTHMLGRPLTALERLKCIVHRMQTGERMAGRQFALPPSIAEALNSGDGTYKP